MLGLALLAGIGHVGTSVFIGLVGVFAEKGVSKNIALFLENATPMLLIVFGFGYAAYALYKQQVGSLGHSHGIPIVNKWLGINAHAYDLPGQTHGHAQDVCLNLGGKFIICLHKLDIVTYVVHDDHMHSYDATTENDHEHKHYHGEQLHEHPHNHSVKGIDGFVHSHGDQNPQDGVRDLKDKRAREAFDRLGVPFTAEQEARCANLQPTSVVKGTPKQQKWREHNPDAIERILPTIAPMMRELGYDPDA